MANAVARLVFKLPIKFESPVESERALWESVAMLDTVQIEYFRRRERQERELAAKAIDAGIVAVHLQFAQHYSEIIAEGSLGRRQHSFQHA